MRYQTGPAALSHASSICNATSDCRYVTVMFRGLSRFLRTNPVSVQRSMSHSSLDGKVAIVTASTDGIGLAAAQALGKRGAHVVVSSRRQANVDKAVALLKSQSIRVTGTTCNVGKGEDREKLVQLTVDQCGGIDILVSNAAVNPFFGNILDSTEDVWDKILSVNVKAAFLLTKLVVPHMEKRGGGNVIFVSSVGGYQPMQGLGPYCVSKTALLGLTRALAPELAHSNIRVNCVAPGVIKTRFSSALWENKDVVDELKKQLSIKRLGEPEEIGGTIAFLCSDDASYITGETVTVTGGMSCRL
ncbi:dehydrogenase/reductase SDR family member 4 isoform X1 [Gambusia affinis]|uniref:dehydrogenase/reductase SDR family member 4 isoform X1 n=1 Tax=Gambusia affinis TaxID=33528 RepID=UPI001CDD2C4A|nr:dehydrogenase/reductase SDR family member 4 isoform X1 [Gambusia affinis]